MTENASRDDTESIHLISDPIEIARRHAEPRYRVGQTPENIGPYKILSELGAGGMGIVYLAEQSKPIHRRVALKIIKLGMDTRQVIARFETEREALALMNHPNVARVFDAGATDQGRPFFAMEYIAGIPITDYCDKHRLNTEERLRLFREVCHAVQHAHQKGIIHRDIKPSNVLVTVQDGRPTPKVIDFGVAKATQRRLTENTIFTEQGQLIGTPGYMSPEQAEMTALDIDTRTDIYSLGVLLYELLVGVLPFEDKTLVAGGLAEIQRIIREVDPPKPSTRLSSLGAASTAVAHQRRTQIRTLARELRGDVDWIVMKCLEKDRTRRYDAAYGLALEIERYLNHEPVLAGPPNAAYRLRKFVRRNRTLVAAAGCVIVALLLGLGGTAWQALRATRERDRAVLAEQEQSRERRLAEDARAEAETRRKEIEQVAEFQASMFTGLDAKKMGSRLIDTLKAEGRAAMEQRGDSQDQVDAQVKQLDELLAGANATNVAVRNLDENILTLAEEAIDKKFTDQPLVQARLFQTVADVLHRLGLDGRAGGPQTRALDIRRRLLGNDHPDTLTSINNMGLVLRAQGKLEDAKRYYTESLEGRRRILGGDHLDTLTAINNLGFLLKEQGKLAEAEPYFREALLGHKRVLGDDHANTLISISNMGGLLQAQGKLAEAEPYLREALERGRRLVGDDHPDTLASINNMGVLLQGRGKLAEAEPFIREAMERRRRVLGNDHPATLASINNLGALLQMEGKLAESEPYLREALQRRRTVLGNDHQDTLVSINNMGRLHRDLGQAAEGEQLGAEAVRRARNKLPAGHWMTAVFLFQHAQTLAAMSRFEESETEMLEAHEIFVAALGPKHDRTIKCVEQLVALYDIWNAADPDKDHTERAEHYRSLLASSREKPQG